MNGWAKKPMDRMEMYSILAKIYVQTASGFGKMGLAMFIRQNGGPTVRPKYNVIAKAIIRCGLLTKQGKCGRGISYRWNLKKFGPVSIPMADELIAETENQIRINAKAKRRNKKNEQA